MSIPTKAIDRIIERLTATYGNEFMAGYSKVPIADMKSAWASAMDAFGTERGLHAIAWALSPENLPERAPNAIQFRSLCLKAPAPAEELPALPLKADPERLAAEFAKLGTVKAAPARNTFDKSWAIRHGCAERDGAALKPVTRRFWREALGYPQSYRPKPGDEIKDEGRAYVEA